MMDSFVTRALALYVLLCFGAQGIAQYPNILDSGGPLSQEQAAYNVKHYSLQLDVNPAERSIDGELIVTAEVVHPMQMFVLDLDTLLNIESIEEKEFQETSELRYDRRVGQVWIDMGYTRQPGDLIEVRVEYYGKPRVAPNPPWSGGFTWKKTPSGADWIATSCQGEGADIWWPCKDHVSDEPDSMDLFVTVPSGLVAACNGTLEYTSETQGKKTYHWHISQPINIYNVALNIAPYEVIETDFKSVSGETYPFQFYVLPEDLGKGKVAFEEFQDHMRWFERLLGPYPFRGDKYGIAQTPHLGMEHQSIIAYGANFNNQSMTGGLDWGFDALHQHELAHEWWGNVITNTSWEDLWIHEGFAAYMQALYCEDLGGFERYYNYMRSIRRFGNTLSVAPRKTMTADEIYRAPIYFKGAWVLHTLRYYIGDEAFFEALKLMVYPTEELLNATDGSQCRFVTTDDFQRICESVSGLDLTWFFELYLRQPSLPTLQVVQTAKEVSLSWDLPIGEEFPIPVEVRIGDEEHSVLVPKAGVAMPVEEGQEVAVDPRRMILCQIKD